MEEKNKNDKRNAMLVVVTMVFFLVFCIMALSWVDSSCQRLAKKNDEFASEQSSPNSIGNTRGKNCQRDNEQGEHSESGQGEHSESEQGKHSESEQGKHSESGKQEEHSESGQGEHSTGNEHNSDNIQENKTVNIPDVEMGKQESYRVISGKVSEIEISLDWNDFEYGKVLSAKKPAVIELSDETVVELVGTMALGKGSREYGMVEGGATFKVVDAELPFTMRNSVGVLTVDTADFEIELNEIPIEDEDAQPGDNGKEMKLKVLTGEVKVQKQDFQKVELVSAGEEKIFRLEAVNRNGEITAIGFALANPKFKGSRGKIMKKRGAKRDAERCLAEFSGGMHFSAETRENGYTFKEATFLTRGMVSVFQDECEYSDLNDEVLLCTVVKKMPKENAVARRNMPIIEGFGGTPIEIHKCLPMAIKSARNNATLHAIRKAASEVYGEPIPEKLSGTFYAEYLSIDYQDGQVIATVKGQVVFE